ncbi:MAG TPA: hypothetical protein VF407_18160, partial [Polyangiaceae bacterium]
MRRILASIAVVSIAACGGDRAASKNAAPSVTADIPPAPAKPAAPVSVSTVTVTDAGVAVAAEPEIDPSTAEGAARWLASLCAHANAKDTSWVVAHVSPLIRGSAIHARENGELQLERLISYGPNRFREDLVRDVGTDGSICDVLKLPASAITGFTDDSISASGLFRAPNVSYRFAITKGEPALLSGLAVDLPPHPMPKRAKKHAFEIITDTIQETGAQTSAVS